MKGYFWSVIFLFLSIFFILLAITYMQVNLKILNDKDDLWKESLYYGSNKAYFRTMNEGTFVKKDAEGNLIQDADGNYVYDKEKILEDLYNFSADDPSVEDFIQVKKELQKDINYFRNSNNTNYKVAGVKAEADDPCLLYIYISRKERTEEVYNTVKVGLCPRKV